jgi:hypothetical protein
MVVPTTPTSGMSNTLDRASGELDAHAKRRQSSRIGKLVKQLGASAKDCHFKAFNSSVGTVTDQRRTFREWILKLQSILRYSVLSSVLQNYPVISDAGIDIVDNAALGQFTCNYLATSTEQAILGVTKNDTTDGVAILRHLHKSYATTSSADRQAAHAFLEAMSFGTRDTISSYTNRFHKRYADYNVIAHTSTPTGSIATETIDNNMINTLYLSRLVATIPADHALRSTALEMYRKLERDIQAENTTALEATSITTLQHELVQVKNITATTTTPVMSNVDRSRRIAPRASQAPRVSANAIGQFPIREIRCWQCGEKHHLKDCRKATDATEEGAIRQTQGRTRQGAAATAPTAKRARRQSPPPGIRAT